MSCVCVCVCVIWSHFIARLTDTMIYTHIGFCLAKMARLKQAKEEAAKEIVEFHAQMEVEFQRKVAEAARISHDVVQMLLRHVTSVKN